MLNELNEHSKLFYYASQHSPTHTFLHWGPGVPVGQSLARPS